MCHFNDIYTAKYGSRGEGIYAPAQQPACYGTNRIYAFFLMCLCVKLRILTITALYEFVLSGICSILPTFAFRTYHLEPK